MYVHDIVLFKKQIKNIQESRVRTVTNQFSLLKTLSQAEQLFN